MCRHQKSRYENIIFAVLLLVGFFLITCRFAPPVKLIKNLVYYISYPTLRTADYIFHSVGSFAANVKKVVYIHQENIAYKRENQKLADKLRDYDAMSEKYESLSRLLKLAKIKSAESVFAGVSFRSPDEWYQWFIIDKGETDGLYNGLPVAVLNKRDDALCAAGKIVETYRTSSKVALITNSISVIPVEIKGKSVNCLAEGFNTSLLRITYIPSGAGVGPGDEIVVSGLSAVFQKGMPVGVIKNVSKETSSDFKTATAEAFYETGVLYEAIVLIPRAET
ncbi:MAG: rod shape-determining protein MreC [Endomicrobium sp.]|jgi:rod shape-determining protein MreC|nr:rod shape-determining protein MreC [Endomicrobium sp.]